MNTKHAAPKNKYNIWIWIVSIVIPVAVAILFTVRIPGVERMGFLPPIYASVNALTAVFLIMALFWWHHRCIGAVLASSLGGGIELAALRTHEKESFIILARNGDV